MLDLVACGTERSCRVAWYVSHVGQTTQMTKRVLFCLLCWQLTLFGQDGAGFDVIGAGTPDKQSVLKGVERDFFSPLSQEQWNALPTMLEVTFQFEPRRGNTDRLGDTFLLNPHFQFDSDLSTFRRP